MTYLDQDRHRNWLAVLLLVDFDAGLAELGNACVERELLWELRAHLGARRRDGGNYRTDLTVRQMTWIVQSFRGLWPDTSHPSGATIGDTNPWDATEFLRGLIARIGDNVGDDAILAMSDLCDVEDGYSFHLQIVTAEQRRKLVETRYTPPTLDAVAAALAGGTPTSAADLQAVMLEELEVAQARLKGDPIDWYKGFFKPGGVHKSEEDCRDELLKLLDGKAHGVQLRPESHLADEKRVDIECSTSTTIMVPIEVKGQWHPALWSAADDQLDKLYANDWRADRRGIYLVLWFGSGTTLTKPPTKADVPTTPSTLKDALKAASQTARSGRVEVVVLDLTRPNSADLDRVS